MNDRELRNRFNHHPPKGNQIQRYAVIREHCLDLARIITHLTPDSREQARALTALDDVMMNANAAIARNERWELRDQWVRVDQERASTAVGYTPIGTEKPLADARVPAGDPVSEDERQTIGDA